MRNHDPLDVPTVIRRRIGTDTKSRLFRFVHHWNFIARARSGDIFWR